MNKTEQSLTVEIATGMVPSWKGDALIIGVYEDGEAQPALLLCGKIVEEEVQKRLSEKWLRVRWRAC